ncbi:MAG: sulfotransferase family protein [Phycisphaerales bacterium JB063]
MPEEVTKTMSSPQPVFMVGSVRSGTTLLRLCLDYHPEITFLHESEFLFRYLDEQGNSPAPNDYLARLEADWVYRESGLTADPSLGTAKQIDHLLTQRAIEQGSSVAGATIHHDYTHIPRYYPDAKYIHLIRDGRDVANSVVGMLLAGNKYYASDVWLRAVREWEVLKPKLREDQYIEIRFEDFVRDSDATLAAICAFLGLPFTEAMYSFEETTTYSRPEPSPAERWRSWSKQELSALERKLGKTLQAYGYPLSTEHAEGSVGAFERLGLWLDNKRRVASARIDRYGLPLYAKRQLVKLFPIPAYRASVLEQVLSKDLACRK